MSSACILDQSCFYTAGNVTASWHSGFTPIVIFIICIVNQVMAVGVSLARRKYGVQYPNLYAYPGMKICFGKQNGETLNPVETLSEENANLFNCVQRGHQNFLENVPFALPLIVMTWFAFPLLSAIAGLIWIVGRYLYFYGYSTGDPKGRVGYGAPLHYVGLLMLWGLAIAQAVYFFEKKLPF